jgi:triosephosphate isomerase
MMRSAMMARRTATSMSARSFATRTPIVGGNWKMNAASGTTNADVKVLVDGLNASPAFACEAYVAPPALYLQSVAATIDTARFNVTAQVSRRSCPSRLAFHK